MFGNLVRAHVLENLYGIKFIITFVVCIVLVVAATISGINKYEDQIKDQADIVIASDNSLIEAGNWRSVSRTGQKVVKSATPLTIFSSGLEGSVGRTATVKEGDFPQMEDSIYSTAPIFAVFGDLDLTFIVKIVISLFAILFTYDLICGEKERGTLKLCLSNSIPRNTFILSKSTGAFISMLIPLVIPLAIALLLALVMGDINFSGEEWMRISWIILGYLFYMLAFFSIGVFVSTVTKYSSISFLILLFFWVLIVLIVPKGAMLLADQAHPISSVNEVRVQQHSLRQNFNTSVWEETMTRIPEGTQRDWRTIRALRNEVREELEPEYERENAKLIDNFKREQANLTNLAINLSRVSPASAVTYIGMNMSGTGYPDQEHFLSQLTQHRSDFTRFIEEEQNKENLDGGRPHGPRSQGQLDITGMPRLNYKRISIEKSLVVVLPDFASLILITIIFYAMAFVMFLKYDVR